MPILLCIKNYKVMVWQMPNVAVKIPVCFIIIIIIIILMATFLHSKPLHSIVDEYEQERAAGA